MVSANGPVSCEDEDAALSVPALGTATPFLTAPRVRALRLQVSELRA